MTSRVWHSLAIADWPEILLPPCRYILLVAMLLLFVAAVGLLMGSAGTRQN